MTAPPIPCVWRGDAFHPLPNFHKLAAEHYGAGEVVDLVAVEDRSAKSHAHYFACVNEAHHNLPEELTERYPTAEHLRKWALIKTGFRDERTIVCSSKAEALRLAAFIRPMDGYAVVTVREAVVTVYTARSQSMKAMGKEEFQRSKEATLGALAEVLGVEPAALARQAA